MAEKRAAMAAAAEDEDDDEDYVMLYITDEEDSEGSGGGGRERRHGILGPGQRKSVRVKRRKVNPNFVDPTIFKKSGYDRGVLNYHEPPQLLHRKHLYQQLPPPQQQQQQQQYVRPPLLNQGQGGLWLAIGVERTGDGHGAGWAAARAVTEGGPTHRLGTAPSRLAASVLHVRNRLSFCYMFQLPMSQ
jgi:hypothetical protein